MIIDSESFAFGDRKGSVASNDLSELDFSDCSHNDISASFNLYFKAARALLTIVFIISFILWVVTASDNEQGGSDISSFNLHSKAARAFLTIVLIISFTLWVIAASSVVNIPLSLGIEDCTGAGRSVSTAEAYRFALGLATSLDIESWPEGAMPLLCKIELSVVSTATARNGQFLRNVETEEWDVGCPIPRWLEVGGSLVLPSKSLESPSGSSFWSSLCLFFDFPISKIFLNFRPTLEILDLCGGTLETVREDKSEGSTEGTSVKVRSLFSTPYISVNKSASFDCCRKSTSRKECEDEPAANWLSFGDAKPGSSTAEASIIATGSNGRSSVFITGITISFCTFSWMYRFGNDSLWGESSSSAGENAVPSK